MRFADIFGKGLVGAITGIDLTDMVNQGGVLGALTGVNLADGGLLGAATGNKTPGLSGMGGLTDLLLRPGDKGGIVKGPYKPDEDAGGLIQMPYKPGQRTHGIADFDGNYNPTYGDFTAEEIQRMNKLYPLGNISK